MNNMLTAGKPVIDAIKLAYESDLPVLLEGPHGVGKSQLIEQAASELGVGCVVRDLSLMEPPDLIGLPEKKGGRTIYLPPDFLPDDGKGLLAFEELNRAERYMMAPCLQLLTARRLNDYTLPRGWLPVAAINPAADGYDTHELDPALLSRFIRVEVKAAAGEWSKWAERNGVHPAVIAYVKDTDGVFDSSNPRSWTYVSDLLGAGKEGGRGGTPVLAAAICGLVGETHASAFLRAYAHGGTSAEVPDAAEILRGRKSTLDRVRLWAEAKDTARLGACAHAVRTALQNSDLCAEIAGDSKMKKALQAFIGELPADLAGTVRADARRQGALQ